MRKLAKIEMINGIVPIEGKDKIVLATVGGWNVIIQKDLYQVGDLVVFVEPDSLLPEKPEFEFLRSKKFKIKTMKLGHTVSQGICFPLSILPQDEQYFLEDDVTEILGIKNFNDTEEDTLKIEKAKTFKNPILKYLMRYEFIRKLLLPKKKNKGGFPEFISKSDEIRCQNISHILKEKDIKYVVREKLDGTSVTFYLKKIPKTFFWQKTKYDFGVCSRNLRLYTENNSVYWQVAKKYNIEKILERIIGNEDFVAIQGEILAPSVQKNKYNVNEPKLYCFNLIYPSGKIDCLTAERLVWKYGLEWCPLVEESYTMPDTIEELLEHSTGTSKLYDTLREGLVYRNYKNDFSFKAVSPDFLIKHKL